MKLCFQWMMMVSCSPKNQPRPISQSSKWIGTHKRRHVLSLLKNSKPLLLLPCIVQFWISTSWHKWISWQLTRKIWMIHYHTNRPLFWKLSLIWVAYLERTPNLAFPNNRHLLCCVCGQNDNESICGFILQKWYWFPFVNYIQKFHHVIDSIIGL